MFKELKQGFITATIMVVLLSLSMLALGLLMGIGLWIMGGTITPLMYYKVVLGRIDVPGVVTLFSIIYIGIFFAAGIYPAVAKKIRIF